MPENLPLISIVIPTYNYAAFLPKALASVFNQTYYNFEIIIIDDGSDDDTRSIIPDLPQVKYYHQENKGLAAARNAGIKKAEGAYLVFLDADDWLEKDALQENLLAKKNKTDVAFVSGNYYLWHALENKREPICASIEDHHYKHLLRRNYIGMHAAVMFQHWVFKEFQYDENLRACEDYDLYLNIARKYPVIHHQKFIANYYFHASGLSHNYHLMMNSVFAVIKKQEPYIQSAEEKIAYFKGLQQWQDYHSLLQ